MAIDQNSVAKDLKPLSFTRKVVEDPRLSSVHDAVAGGGVVGVVSSPMSRLGFERDGSFWGCDSYAAAVHSRGGELTGIWNGQIMPLPPPGEVDFQVNWASCNALAEPSSGELVQHWPNEGSDGRHGVGEDSSNGGGSRHHVDTSNSGYDLTNAEGGDDSWAKKVKFLCSFGGKILPRPSDGMLRYVGGQTRIISTRNGISYQELMQKMEEAYGQSVVIKYQLPNEDLDALVSVSSDEDVENMMEEYDRLLGGPVDGLSSSKLRLFLFSADEIDQSGVVQFGDEQDSGQRYVEAVNGILPETAIRRKDSVSTLNSDGPPGGVDVADATPKGQIDSGGLLPPSPSLIRVSPIPSDASTIPYLHPNNPLGFKEVPVSQANLPSAALTGPTQFTTASQPIGNGIDPPPDPFVLPELERPVALMGLVQPGQCLITPPVGYQDDGIQVTKPLNSPITLDSRPDLVSFELHPVLNTGHASTYKGIHKDLLDRPDYRCYPNPEALPLEFASLPASQIGHLESPVVGKRALVYRQPDHLSHQPDDIVGISSNPFHVLQPGYVVAGSAPLSQHMLSNYSSNQTHMKQNGGQKLGPVGQIQTEQFPEQSFTGTRVQPQANLAYKAPQSQAASQLSGQPSKQLHALHQIPPPERLVCPKGWDSQQSEMLPEKATKLEDCYLCQKALPHAHSDPHLQNGNNMKTVYESNPAIHSCCSEGSMKFRPPHWPPGALVQPMVESQDKPSLGIDGTKLAYLAAGSWQRIIAYNEQLTAHHIPTHMSGPYKFSQMPEEKYDPQLMLQPRMERSDGSGLCPPPGMSTENLRFMPAGPNESVAERFSSVLPIAGEENSYGLLNNPAQSCQEVLQSCVPSGSHVGPSALAGVPFTILETSAQESLAGFSSRHHAVSLDEGVSLESFAPPTCTKVTEGMTEALCVNSSKVAVPNEQCKPPFVPNSVPPKEDSIKCTLMDAESQLNDIPAFTTVDTNAIITNEEILQELPDNSASGMHMIAPASRLPVIFDEKHIIPTDLLAANPTDNMLIQSIQPQLSNNISHLEGQPGLFPDLKIHCESTISSDTWNGLPASQCISSMYSTTTGISGSHVLEEDASGVQSRCALDDLFLPLSGAPLPLDNHNCNPKWEGDCLDPVAPTLPPSTCILDPWDLVQDVAMNLTQVTKPVTSEVMVPTDAYKHSFSEICGSLSTILEVEKLSLRQPSNVSNEARANNDFCLGHFPCHKDASEEEHVKQELEAVAEDVATPPLKSLLPQDLILSASEIKSILFGPGVDDKERHDDVPLDIAQTSFDSMAESFRAKIVEISNSGLPLCEDIGRLQIIKNYDLEELRELGSGTFGTVYHGKWRGSDVAIKRINDRCFSGKPSEQQRMRTDFWNEACKLADLHHPNVVAFYGVVLDGPSGTVATVTEYMVNGSLRQALHKNNRIRERRNRIYIAMDVAFGMEYLHGKNIVHFDLKSDNLLVNLRDPQHSICKIGDLGLSKVKCQTLISGGVRGTLPWMAPELLNGSSTLVSEKVDVFSFGIVMWELLTGEEPYVDLHYGAIIGGIVSNTLRPQVPEQCDPDWKSLMEKCWSSNPSERPSFTEIASTLRSMAASLQSKGQDSQPQNQR